MPDRSAEQRIDGQVQCLAFNVPQRQFQTTKGFDQTGIMCIQKCADLRDAATTAVVNVQWINAPKLRSKLVGNYVGLLYIRNFAPADDSRVGLDPHPSAARLTDEVFIQVIRLFGFCRIDVRRSPPFPYVAVKRKLRDNQRASFYVQ